MILTPALYQEIAAVAQRPALVERFGITEEAVTALFFLLERRALQVDPLPELPVTVRDPKDEMVLAAALGGQADYLVTGDDDLLTLQGDPQLGSLQIVTPRQFLEKLGLAPT